MYINRQNIDEISTIKSFSEGKAQRRFESMADIFGTFGERPSGAARPPLALRRVFHDGSVPAQRGSEAPPWSPITRFKIKPFEMWQRLDKQQQQKDTVSKNTKKKQKTILDVILAIKARTAVVEWRWDCLAVSWCWSLCQLFYGKKHPGQTGGTKHIHLWYK